MKLSPIIKNTKTVKDKNGKSITLCTLGSWKSLKRAWKRDEKMAHDLWKLLAFQKRLELCGFLPPKYVPTSYASEAERYQ